MMDLEFLCQKQCGWSQNGQASQELDHRDRYDRAGRLCQKKAPLAESAVHPSGGGFSSGSMSKPDDPCGLEGAKQGEKKNH